jgi:GlpG protein
MRRIGNLDTKQHADRFANYLTVQGIASQVDEHNGEWSIWIKDEDQLNDSRAELANFRENSDDPRYVTAAIEAQKVREQEQTRREQAASNRVDVRQTWNRSFTRRAPLTAALIGVSVVVGLLSDSVFQPQAKKYVGNRVFRTLAFYDPQHFQDPDWLKAPNLLVDISHGQVWRLATPAFLHMGLTHLMFNMFMLYSLGGIIESRQHSLRILALFVMCSIAGNLGEYVFGNTGVGMSGVVYGLFGYLWVYGLMAPQDRLGVRKDTIIILVAWLVLGFAGVLEKLLGVGVANWAHLFGMLMGMLVAVVAVWLDANLKKRKPPSAA